MPNQAAQAFIVANSQVQANANAHFHVHAAMNGVGSLSPNPTANYKGTTLHILGQATVSPNAKAHWQAHAGIFGNSTFQTWRTILAAGTTTGAGTLAPANPIRIRYVAGPLEGSGAITGSVVQVLILGARIKGAGDIRDGLLVTAAGALSGAGAISARPRLIIAGHPLPMVGSGGIHDSVPLPMVGHGDLTAFFEVLQVPRPFCPPRAEKVFRYGYILTRGDLELRICDASGNPYAPVVVLFAFYQIVAGGQRMLAGPPNRRPAVDTREGKVGRYYATGTAGELGQPGEWVIVWRFQRSWWTPTEFFEEHFKVVDEVTSGDPGALFGRCIKYGWL